jgi:zinc protease
MMAYKVGSADEDLDATGLSHYLEHLMFKGTEKIKPGDIDRLTLRNGGANNAYTFEDATVYHFDFAADRWEAALDIEADRMRNLRIDKEHEFEQEKGAVIEELQRNEDEPWDLEQKAILPHLFSKESPYGHPVIGEREHVRGATAKVIKSHYDKWYHPNNAVLVVCGGFDAGHALEIIKKRFEPIPQAKLPARKAQTDISRKEPRRLDVESKFDVPRLLVGFNTVKSGDDDSYTLDVLDALLSGGKTGRLYKTFVEGSEMASTVGTSNFAGRYPGWFSVEIELIKGKDPKAAEKLLREQLQALIDKPVAEAELNRVKQMLLAANVFSRESVHGLADGITRGVLDHDLKYLQSYLDRIQKVTAEEVQTVAKKYLNLNHAVLVWSIPKAEKTESRLSVPGWSGPMKITEDILDLTLATSGKDIAVFTFATPGDLICASPLPRPATT